MRLSKLSNRQLRRLLARGEVRFGNDEEQFQKMGKRIVSLTENILDQLHEGYTSKESREISLLLDKMINDGKRVNSTDFIKGLNKLLEARSLISKWRLDFAKQCGIKVKNYWGK